MKNRTVLYAGSFDPVTNGHLDIIRRAQQIFGTVTVLVMKNGAKNNLFSIEERLALLRLAVAGIPQVTVETADGLLADYARQHNCILVRGLRGFSDMETEFTQAHFNRLLAPGLETIFLPCDEKWRYVSSSIVREIARCGGDFSAWVPAAVVPALRDKFLR